ncbi:MAG: DUF115 domain-containing protein [Methylococcales bacterium]|nr:DUF115 domain-containing protein [Methylococcales bacterium]
MPTTNFSNHSSNTLKTNIFNERYLYSINRDSFSKVSASAIFEAEFKTKIFDENTLYIILGTDSGLLPQYLQKQGIPAGTRYLFIELNEVLSQLHQYHLLDNLNSEIVCTTHKNWENEAEKLKIEQYSYINSVTLKNAICAQQNSSEEYTELNWNVSESLQTIHWQHSVKLATESFVHRQLENIADAQLPAKILENAYQGQTVIILAGGPSLIEILPWVKENRQNLVIFSVSRISKQLLKADLTPDFIFSVDPQKVSFDVSHEMLSFNNQPILIHANHIFPQLLNQWQGISLYLGQRVPWKSTLNVENLNSAGPTVTNTALTTAFHFGFKQILLAGVDLCFAKNGITHAKGSAEQIAGPKYNTTSLQVETYNGEYRETGEDYYFALEALGQQAKHITNNNDKTIINLAPTAAKTSAITHLPAGSIKLVSLSKPALEIANSKIDSTTNIDKANYLQKVITSLEKANHHINRIKTLSKKANHINASMYNNDGIIENYKDKKRLDKIEKILNTKHQFFSKLVKSFGVRQFLKITTPHDDEKNWSAEQAQELGKIYYDAYESGSKKLSSILNQAISSTKARQEELKDAPNFQLLFNTWETQHSYKRAEIWKNNHPDILISEEINQEFIKFSNKFIHYVLKAKADLKTILDEDRSNIHFFKHKAKLLFNSKRLVELKDLKEKFLTDTLNKEKDDYLYLISAYIAELERATESALNFYNKIIDTESTILLEEALTRITSISIEQLDHQNAFLALECLTQISPVYLPYYAESARLLGNVLLAIDSYITYINFFPEDTIVQLKLASLYISNKMYEAAELMLDHILISSPNLDAVHTLKNLIKNQKENTGTTQRV